MEQENTPQIIKTIGENGEEIFMKLQEIVSLDGKDYALLSIVEDDKLPTNDNDEADELVIMRMIKTDDECTFEIIEDDDEFNSVAQAITDSEDFEE
ncbi:MAG: DUF1292 domain-containing protein [Candidatus Gastranaerophilales bacterium]|nr:DUF1292 domain-containing protein [Candidatus Gastranaerophilales bacterium]